MMKDVLTYMEIVCNHDVLVKCSACGGVYSPVRKCQPSLKLLPASRQDLTGGHIVSKVVWVSTTAFDTLPELGRGKDKGIGLAIDGQGKGNVEVEICRGHRGCKLGRFETASDFWRDLDWW